MNANHEIPEPRMPTDEELQLIAELTRMPDDDPAEHLENVTAQRITVFDNYITDSPGYTGRVAVIVWGAGPGCVSVCTLDGSTLREFAGTGLRVRNELMLQWVVAVHLEDRAYGGPEEGGWWFNYGQPESGLAEHTKVFDDREKAYEYRNKLQTEVCDPLNEGRRPISSVLSEGLYTAIVQSGNQPFAWPTTTPHYE